MSTLKSAAATAAKVILIGESGAGKTGAVASLVAEGYKVRIIDTDNGAATIAGLVYDDPFGYSKLIQRRGISIDDNVSVFSVSSEMGVVTVARKMPDGRDSSERLLAPKNAKAWQSIVDQMEHWRDKETGADYGHIASWDEDTVLVVDSFTTVSRQAYYFVQALNGRLGSREEGRTHQRDVGGAQSLLRRFLEAIYNPGLRCNVVLICHIQRIDDHRGIVQTPEAVKMDDPEAIIEVKGVPESVGISLSKKVGVYFNNSFIVRQTGTGTSLRREIKTLPTTIDGVNIAAKMSVPLRPDYSVATGLAEIFAALRGKTAPAELLSAIRRTAAAGGAAPAKASPTPATATPAAQPQQTAGNHANP